MILHDKYFFFNFFLSNFPCTHAECVPRFTIKFVTVHDDGIKAHKSGHAQNDGSGYDFPPSFSYIHAEHMPCFMIQITVYSVT